MRSSAPASSLIIILACLPAISLCRNLPSTIKSKYHNAFPFQLYFGLQLGDNLEEGEFFQGDIRLIPGQFDKNGMLLDAFKWPNATVFYKLEGVFGEKYDYYFFRSYQRIFY